MPFRNCLPIRRFQLTPEHNKNYVLHTFMEEDMVKTFVHEAAALASLALFVSMIAVWTQVLGHL